MNATTLPHISLLFVGLCALLQTGLTALVVARRLKARVNLLDGGDQTLIRRIRAHGNVVETVPMVLLLMSLLEMAGGPSTWIWGIGALLVAGRLLHAVGLLARGAHWARLAGMSMTLAAMSLGGVAGLWQFLR